MHLPPDISSSGRAPFIAFEGIEGCGKSTQIERLAAHLSAARRRFIITREPGGTPLGDALRDILLSPASQGIDGQVELYLLEAARRVHVQRVIRPALEGGVIVISDRYADSSVAYQGGGRGLGAAMVEALNAQATDSLRPDLTLLLDVLPEIGLARVGRRPRPEDRMEREALAFHERVRAAYLDLASRHGQGYRVVDASRDPEVVYQEVAAHLMPILLPGDAT